MGKGKLEKFADLKTFGNVFEFPYSTLREMGLEYDALRAGAAAQFAMKGRWNKDYFANDNPIVLELGCGKGEYTVGLARMFPDKNFVGIDIKGARIWTGAKQALDEGLKNVAFLRTNIELIDYFFAENEVEEIWLTFSDPQQKNARKRLTSTGFLERYRHFLADGGVLHVKTDSNFLYTYTTALVEKNALPVIFSTADLYHAEGFDEVTRQILGIQTYYESMWMSRGIPIKYIKFRLPHDGTLAEPDIDIPLDEYRSYHRPKRSGKETSR